MWTESGTADNKFHVLLFRVLFYFKSISQVATLNKLVSGIETMGVTSGVGYNNEYDKMQLLLEWV